MTDLRERLTAYLDGYPDETWASTGAEAADAAIGIFADWLRDEAAKFWRNRELSDEEGFLVGYVQAMADVLDPADSP